MGEYRRPRVKLSIPRSFRNLVELKTHYCGTKVAYQTKKDAQTKANQRFNEDHVKLRIYPCGSHWHLTHKLYEKETDS